MALCVFGEIGKHCVLFPIEEESRGKAHVAWRDVLRCEWLVLMTSYSKPIRVDLFAIVDLQLIYGALKVCSSTCYMYVNSYKIDDEESYCRSCDFCRSAALQALSRMPAVQSCGTGQSCWATPFRADCTT